jgi:hypothetical protein
MSKGGVSGFHNNIYKHLRFSDVTHWDDKTKARLSGVDGVYRENKLC